MLIKGFKHLDIYLFLAQKFSNFFIALSKVVEIFGNFFENYPPNNFSYLELLSYLEVTMAKISI